MFTTKIYDVRNSIVMGLDVLGTALELKREKPVTIGGQALKRYRKYLQSFVPENYAPELHPKLRLKRYFEAEGLEIAPTNLYAGWIASFFSWPLLPIVQLINFYRVLKRTFTDKKTSTKTNSQTTGSGHGAPSYGE